MGISKLLDRPIAFHRCFVTLTGSVTGAVMLSQALYWSHRTKGDGWFYKTQVEWEDETGLTRTQQENIRKELSKLAFWQEELRGMPGRLHFRIDHDKLDEKLLSLFAGNLQTRTRETDKAACGKPANKNAGNLQTFIETETTTETTTEIEATASPQASTSLSKHPAIQLIRSLTNRYPDKSLWPRIVEALGDTPDEQIASRCYSEWVGRGWNKMNLTWLFDWYKNGGPQLSAQKGNMTYAKTGTGNAQDHSAIVAGFRARTIE